VNLAVLLEREGDTRRAAQAYSAVIRDYPEDGLARARLAALYQQSGQLDEAWRLSREALQRDPGNLVAYRTMARVALARNDLDLARLVALRAQKVAPDDPEVAFLGGQIAAKQGDAAGAAAQWRRALALQPGFPPARKGLLDAAARQSRWAEAAELASAILKDDPSSAQVQLVLGIAQRHLGKADDALRSYEAAEQLGAGRLPEVHLARAILLMRDKSDCPGALRSFDAYERAVGPMLPQGSPAPRLMRECQEQVEQGRQAADAARQLQAEAERKAAARKAAEPAPGQAPAGQPPAGAVPPQPGPEGAAPPPPARPAEPPKKP
jgi:tetratricopeptide (TPR) repeat protein